MNTQLLVKLMRGLNYIYQLFNLQDNKKYIPKVTLGFYIENLKEVNMFKN